MADASPGVERDAQGYSWALWSRDFPVEYSPGEVVLVALNRDPATGLARIVKLDVEEPSVYRGRALVQYFDKENSFAHVRPARLNKLLFAHNERRVIVVRTTDDYRALAKSQVVGKHGESGIMLRHAGFIARDSQWPRFACSGGNRQQLRRLHKRTGPQSCISHRLGDEHGARDGISRPLPDA